MEYQNRNKEDFEKCLKVLIGNPQVKNRCLLKMLIEYHFVKSGPSPKTSICNET